MTYSTDTRSIQPGEIYVAIRGEVHDGHRFIPRAIEKGASGIVTEQDVDAPEGVEVIRVESSEDYLVATASEKLRQSGARVVAITGSIGKTTTRAALHAVLAQSFPVVPSEGNRNTPLGLSLLVLNREITADSVLVLEMGARLKGDIKTLCEHFPPDISVVTNVRGVHVETFGSIDGVQREKSELVRALGPEGVAVLNADDPRTRAMADLHEGTTLLYGRAEDADLRPDAVRVDLPILGDHAILTALSAVAVGRALGMDDDAIQRGLAAIQPEKGRLAKLPGRDGSTLIDDTYNASPDAALAALDVLAGLPSERRIAVLGDMLELGETEVEQHIDVLRAATERADRVIAVGAIMARAAPSVPGVEPVATSADLAESIRQRGVDWPREGDVILVKGSQGARMERVSEAVLSPDVEASDVLPRQTPQWKAIP
ncbi:MAG TPA: UDP-N-acetylmuramoyl-tripeptide--D-alanyl-D-alanine ligase [Bacteroidetes bacterium]|nr:UDP-N-acetylmuramoyl-tripeptide--D-alanyl-D-alanine ligase [Bacteroidota bacterium]HIL59002.1 UDP-N-acetylmuramoyl-tripeptide--D-alanyl-D-alanine ligase [Rhodothermales bacterium]